MLKSFFLKKNGDLWSWGGLFTHNCFTLVSSPNDRSHQLLGMENFMIFYRTQVIMLTNHRKELTFF